MNKAVYVTMSAVVFVLSCLIPQSVNEGRLGQIYNRLGSVQHDLLPSLEKITVLIVIVD